MLCCPLHDDKTPSMQVYAQTELADKSGVSRVMIGKHERGRYKINRNDEIVVKRIFVPKAAAPQAINSEEFEWRLLYARNPGRGLPIFYEIRNGYLKTPREQ